MGGGTALAQSSLPSVVFVFANALGGLVAGLGAALGVAAMLIITRLSRRQPLRTAIGSVVGLGVSSFLAYRSGSAGAYFLPDIWFDLAGFAVLTTSIVARRPLVGVIWSVLNEAPAHWRQDKPSLVGYDIATAAVAGVFAGRFVMQGWLMSRDDTGWPLVVRTVAIYPLWVAAAAVVVWAIRRSDRRLRTAGE
jgi:hypothetical protein